MKKFITKFWFLIFILLFISKTKALDKAVGLKNLGNTCFMNSTLQCLLGLDKFNDILVENTNKYLDNDKTISKEYINLFETYKSWSGNSAIDPSIFCTKMWPTIFNNEGQGEQQDAHELLVKLLSYLTNTNIKKDNEQLKNNISNQIITQLKSTISDTKTPKRFEDSATIEPETNISVELSGSKLKYCLSNFFEKEIIEYKPEGHKTNLQANKQYKISKLPTYLIINLKRFIYNLKTNEFDKNDKNITLDLNLDLQSYLSDEIKTQDAYYNLIGIVEHSGSLSGGHYIASAKRDNGEWYKFNDSVVEKINTPPLENIDGFTPYLLFYEKTTDEASKAKTAIKREEAIKFITDMPDGDNYKTPKGWLLIPSSKKLPLIYATQLGRFDIIQTLLANPTITTEYSNCNLDINTKNQLGQTALQNAIAIGDLNNEDVFESIKYLITK